MSWVIVIVYFFGFWLSTVLLVRRDVDRDVVDAALISFCAWPVILFYISFKWAIGEL